MITIQRKKGVITTAEREGSQTIKLTSTVKIITSAAVGGEMESHGPLKACFDYLSSDSYFGQKTWEKAETDLIRRCYEICLKKAALPSGTPDCIFGGDLLNQCVSSAFAVKDSSVPYLGLYGACSTMAEGLALASLLVDGGGAGTACALTGSHFCSAERQYRFPLEYGGQRPPTAQWTVTGAGAVMVGTQGGGPAITYVTPGRIVDKGIKDAANMGAAMAPAALDTILAHFRDTGRDFDYYDAVFTGDLGALGHDIVQEKLQEEGFPSRAGYMDCGVLIYDLKTQDVHAGGSGCGCSASVLAGHIIPAMKRGVWNRVLFCATGALMSPLSCQQGCSIPGICHAVAIENEV